MTTRGRAPQSWDLFCRVIDNLGDAAFAWRLARALAHEHAGTVQLWIDEPDALAVLAPAAADEPRIAIRTLAHDAVFDAPADVAIDAFGNGLPEAYVRLKAERAPQSLWIVTEYLSAEPWVRSYHGLPSPHPRLALARYFFCPGFEAGTGGLLREAGYEAARGEFETDPAARATFWAAHGFATPPRAARVVSLFGYDNAAAVSLARAWAEGGTPVVAAVTRCPLAAALAAFAGVAAAPGTAHRVGALELRFLPFLDQDEYDRLLWCCDWNFVRGEDSLVRAIWARRACVWQAYPQADAAHRPKVEAFVMRYGAGAGATAANALQRLYAAWNGFDGPPVGGIVDAWGEAEAAHEAIATHASEWARALQGVGSFSANLVSFCADRL